ncbi:MAG: hypothetical protein KDA38_16210, partial [Planctomycetales bacterium]|nr:hypothetical protein [Planctomycetales bacterium]
SDDETNRESSAEGTTMHDQVTGNLYTQSHTEVNRLPGANTESPMSKPPGFMGSSPIEEAAPRYWWEDELVGLPTSFDLRREKVIQLARRRFAQSPEWSAFFREILATGGLIQTVFPAAEAIEEFERSGEFAEIQQMLSKLREKRTAPPEDQEPTRVITVRLPASMHKSLLDEAQRRQTSMNKLCISKLLQMIDPAFVPIEPLPKKRKVQGGPSSPTEQPHS